MIAVNVQCKDEGKQRPDYPAIRYHENMHSNDDLFQLVTFICLHTWALPWEKMVLGLTVFNLKYSDTWSPYLS